jgi:hypothetical protein
LLFADKSVISSSKLPFQLASAIQWKALVRIGKNAQRAVVCLCGAVLRLGVHVFLWWRDKRCWQHEWLFSGQKSLECGFWHSDPAVVGRKSSSP